MASLNSIRIVKKKHRREIKTVKRRVQAFLLLSSFVISIVVYIIQTHWSNINSNYSISINSAHQPSANQLQRHLLIDTEDDDGYYINSLNEFPPLLFSLQDIKNGAWILNFIGMFYCFVGIGIVCDDYFVPAIEVIVDRLQMSEDTAGATWMAAGGSAPELFTSFVGTFLAKSDVGFGTIVGSAVFNVLFIIGACAIFTSGKLKIQWWPFVRDMSYYLICLAMLSLFFGGVSKNQMYWWESLILLSMYFLYVFLMSRNEKIRAWVFRRFVDGDDKNDKRTLLSDQDTGYGTEISMQKKMPKSPPAVMSPNAISESNRDEDEVNETSNGHHTATTDIETAGNGYQNQRSETKEDEQDEDDDDDDEEGLDLSFPDTWPARIWYIMKVPLTYPIYYTLFDVTKQEYQGWWPWTFFGSLMWLGGLSYLMVWWAVVVGYAWTVPQEVMGLVFLAAGTSVPELFSCIIVAKRGQADMAVSASIGSNIFDVLIGLPLPWLSYSVLFGEEAGDLRIDVKAHGLFISIIVLMLILLSLLIIILVNKWTLTHCMGYSMIGLYVLFVAQDLLRHYLLDVQF